MRSFIVRILIILGISLVGIELFSRIVIDPFYFYTINTYNEKQSEGARRKIRNQTKHADYIFMGSSRIPATINPELIKELSNLKTVINAGRGYMTPGIHYQALISKLEKYPDYLKDAYVLLEYSGCEVYSNSFEEDRLRVHEAFDQSDESMPHLLLPYLSTRSFLSFMRESGNSSKVKREMFFLYTFSFIRTSKFIHERFHRMSEPIFQTSEENLVLDGGIRSDNIEFVKQKAAAYARLDKQRIIDAPELSIPMLENSSLAALDKLIVEHGGKLVLFEMPLHSIQADIYTSAKARDNKRIFEEWLKEKGIQIVYNTKFEYQDSDFPDTWHLNKGRRDEFSTLLFQELHNAHLDM